MPQIWIALVWKSTLLLGAAALVTSLMRGRSASERHMAWIAALGAVLLIPFLSASLPELPVPLPEPALRLEAAARAVTLPAISAPAATRPSPSGHSAPALPARDWTLAWMALWAAGSAAILLGTARAWIFLWSRQRVARPFAAPEYRELPHALGIRRPVRLLETEPGSMPMTCGLLRPVVFLPADARQWSPERLRMVLLHELAHVRRADAAFQLMARFAVALCWWNPLVWRAWRESLRERERAADDLVLSSGARASEYAGHLLDIARSMAPAPTLAAAAVAMARGSHLEDRLHAILGSGIRRAAPGRAGIASAAAAAILLALPLASVRAQQSDSLADTEATILAAKSQNNFEILDHAAEAASRGLRYDAARTLLDQSLAVRAARNGQASPEYGEGLLRLGRLENLRGNRAAADDFFARAAETLKNHPRASSALIALGASALTDKDYSRAFDLFEQARSIGSAGARPLMWMALVRRHQNNPAEAESLFKSAMAVADPNSPESVTLAMVYANFLESQGRAAEASELAARARQSQKGFAVKPSTATAGVKRIGGAVIAPKLLEKVEPAYSEEARAAKLTGTVVLYIEVWPDGKARNVQVVEQLGLGLDEKAAQAIGQWRFSPGTENGNAVTVAATVEVNFRLK